MAGVIRHMLAAGEKLTLKVSPQDNEQLSREIILKQAAELTLEYRLLNMNDWSEQCKISLVGSHATVKIQGIMHGKQAAILKYFLVIEHLADHTQSNIEFRGVAEARSHLVFDGLIKVAANVVGIIANEQNRNLLLSDTATVESRPRLEIDSNEVICRHGANIGDLDETQLFYLMSRGLSEQEARHILIEAFLGFF